MLLIAELRDNEPRYEDTDALDRLGGGGPGGDVVLLVVVPSVAVVPGPPAVVVVVVPPPGPVVVVVVELESPGAVVGGTADVEGPEVAGGDVAGGDVWGGDVGGGEVCGGEVCGGEVCGGEVGGGGAVVVVFPGTVGNGLGGGAVIGELWASEGGRAVAKRRADPSPAPSQRQAPARPSMAYDGSVSATLSGRVSAGRARGHAMR